jgi:hypothetical protein
MNPVRSSTEALRRRIAVSFAAIGSLVVFDADQRSAVVPGVAAFFQFVSAIWHELVPHAPLPRYGTFDPVFRAEERYLAPPCGGFQAVEGMGTIGRNAV